MPSHFISADAIHNGLSFIDPDSVLEVGEDGRILNILKDADPAVVTHYEGTICPGFVNAHCHLELSHMRGVIPEGTGLIPFLQAVTGKRGQFTDDEKRLARKAAYEELYRNGVNGLGDIANSADTLDLREYGNILMHTFVECLGFSPSPAERLKYSIGVLNQFQDQRLVQGKHRQSLSPHAPYSVSPALFSLIDAQDPETILSIHNQEAAAENQYFIDKTGPVNDLFKGFGIDDSFFTAGGTSSLKQYLPLLNASHPLILVHNTFSSSDDILFAENHSDQIFWCLCPAANQYIEQRLPDLTLFNSISDHICIGTDSLASNSQLSILAELQLLKRAFSTLDWEELLRWGTWNGAFALKMDMHIGSLAAGKKPGILHIPNLNDGTIIHRLF